MTTRPVRKNYSHKIADEHKKRRRKEAEIRLQARKQRGDKGQLAKLNAASRGAKKERKRIGE